MLDFICPQCKRFCSVVEEFAGRRVRCTHCSCRFIVPEQSGQKARLYIEPPQAPLPGFYKEVLLRSWKILFVKDSLVGLVFCVAMTSLQFYLGNLDYSFTVSGPGGGGFRPPLIVGWIAQFFTLGGLCWYFFQTIGSTALYPDNLPDLDIGFGFEYLINLIKSIYLFIVAALLALLPGVAIGAGLDYCGISTWWVKIPILIGSSGLLAMALALFGMELPIWVAVCRPDLVLRTLIKTFRPYLVTALITVIAFVFWYANLLTFASNKDITTPRLIVFLTLRILSVIGMLYAMRTIGLYCRHYKPACPWLWNLKNPH